MPKLPAKKSPAKKMAVAKKATKPGMSPKNSQATMKRGAVIKPAIPRGRYGPADADGDGM